MKKAVRIAHVFPSFAFGGQQVRFATLANNLGQSFAHHVIALDGDFDARRLIEPGVNIAFEDFRHKKSSLASLTNIRGLATALSNSGAELLCTYNWGSIEATIANRLMAHLPHVHFEDGFGPGEGPDNQPGRRVMARRLLLRNTVTIVPSRLLESVAIDQWKLPRKNVRLLTNGIDFNRFQITPDGGGAKIKVGSVGALRPEKNYGRLIRAFVTANSQKNATLTIVGEGPERETLKSMVGELKAHDQVTLPGATRTPEIAYAAFDIFALSSDTEQAPISLIEAMASGLPVVSTNVGDIARMVSDENRAYVTPLNDDHAFSEALTQLLQNPNARAKIGAANRQKARSEFSLSSMVSAYKTLFEEMAAP